MKYLISFIFSVSLALANTLPTDFYLNKNTGFDVSPQSIDDVSNTLDGFFKAGNEILDGINFTQNKSNSDWKLTGFITSLGVSSSGKLGLVAFKGTAFTEVVWRKRAPVQPVAIVLEEEIEGDLVLTDLSKENIDEQVESAYQIVKASGKVTNLDDAKRGLRAKIEEVAETVRGLRVDPTKKYYLAGLRFDLAVGASGNVGTIYTVGANLVLKMVWRPIRKSGAPLVLMENKTSFQKLIDDTALSLMAIDESLLADKKGLKLQLVRVVYGKSIAGKIGLVSAKSSLSLSVIFAKNPKYQHGGKIFNAKSFATKEIIGSDEGLIDWSRFEKGLNKASKLSIPFLKKAEQKNSKWEPYSLRMTFSVSGSKGVGVTTVGDTGQVQLIYSK